MHHITRIKSMGSIILKMGREMPRNKWDLCLFRTTIEDSPLNGSIKTKVRGCARHPPPYVICHVTPYGGDETAPTLRYPHSYGTAILRPRASYAKAVVRQTLDLRTPTHLKVNPKDLMLFYSHRVEFLYNPLQTANHF